MRILLIEDEPRMAAVVCQELTEAGHQVDLAVDGPSGLARAMEASHDVAIIDRLLPGFDGLTLTRKLRAAAVRTPVLFLTTMSGVDDRVEGLEAGADDYLAKPFATAELLARLNALARRPPLAGIATVLRIADLEMDLIARSVRRATLPIELQPREFQLLEFLMRNAGSLVTRRQLLEQVWDFHFDPQTNIVETHMSRLRAKIDRGFDPWLIKTVRGSGYMMRDDPA